ncbi:hypothetical protein [Nostoc sp.]|uniref:hypothetical protein n=1 Tax=Nostoc sp. TaxID=1180 RepID=UPI002FFB0328
MGIGDCVKKTSPWFYYAKPSLSESEREHWCQLNLKASLELVFRLPRSQSETGNACLWGCRLSLLAAEPLLSCISSASAGNEI